MYLLDNFTEVNEVFFFLPFLEGVCCEPRICQGKLCRSEGGVAAKHGFLKIMTLPTARCAGLQPSPPRTHTHTHRCASDGSLDRLGREILIRWAPVSWPLLCGASAVGTGLSFEEVQKFIPGGL